MDRLPLDTARRTPSLGRDCLIGRNGARGLRAPGTDVARPAGGGGRVAAVHSRRWHLEYLQSLALRSGKALADWRDERPGAPRERVRRRGRGIRASQHAAERRHWFGDHARAGLALARFDQRQRSCRGDHADRGRGDRACRSSICAYALRRVGRSNFRTRGPARRGAGAHDRRRDYRERGGLGVIWLGVHVVRTGRHRCCAWRHMAVHRSLHRVVRSRLFVSLSARRDRAA